MSKKLVLSPPVTCDLFVPQDMDALMRNVGMTGHAIAMVTSWPVAWNMTKRSCSGEQSFGS